MINGVLPSILFAYNAHMKKKLLYWIPTGLLLLVMVGSAIMYFSDIPTTAENFELLGYPAYTLYINGIAKILGGIALVFPVSRTLKEWAYAGYLYILILATQSLYVMMPANAPVMLAFIVLWGLSYWRYRIDYAK